MSQVASYLLPFSLQLINKNQVMQMDPLLFAVFLLLIILALGGLGLQTVPLLLLILILCLCLLRQNRASLGPSALLIVLLRQLTFLLLVLLMPVSWLLRFLVLVAVNGFLALLFHLACILQCWVYLVLQELMIWLVFLVMFWSVLGLVLALVNLEP